MLEAQHLGEMDQLEFVENYYQALVVNPKSSVVHAVTDNGKLLCGRPWNEEYQDIPTSVQLSSLPFCCQCENAKLSRLKPVRRTDNASLEEGGGESEVEQEVFTDLEFSDLGDWEEPHL